MIDKKLYQCPYNKACQCAMDEPCNGCEDFKPAKDGNETEPKAGMSSLLITILDKPIWERLKTFYW